MAGAFTAQADDPSLLFHNAGGLAFVRPGRARGRRHLDQGRRGRVRGRRAVPGLGRPAPSRSCCRSSRPTSTTWRRSTPTWKWGIGVNAPFGLATEWKNPDTFAGRFVSTKAALTGDRHQPHARLADHRPTSASASAPSAASPTSSSTATSPPSTRSPRPRVDVGQVQLESDLRHRLRLERRPAAQV